MKILFAALLLAFLTGCSSDSQNAQEAEPLAPTNTIEKHAEPVTAQDAVVQTAAEQMPVEQIPAEQVAFSETQFGDWFRICAKDMPEAPCQAVQVMEMDNDEGKSRLLESIVMRPNPEVLVMQLLLPLGVDIRPGIALQIGDEAEFTQQYLTCVPAGCLVVMELSPERLAQMQQHEIMKLGFRPANTEQTVVLDISLQGFSDAIDGL